MLESLKKILSSNKYPAPGGEMMSIRKMAVSVQPYDIQASIDGKPLGDKSMASFHSRRFDEVDDLADLDAALKYNMAVVEAAQSEGHSTLPHYFETLASFHSTRFDRAGNIEDLRASLKYNRAAVDATSADSRDLARRLQSLGVSYSTIFRELGELNDLETAIKFHYSSIHATHDGDVGLLTRKCNLSASYYDRFDRLGDKDDLDMSLRLDLSVLDTVAMDDPELPRYQASIAVTYGTRFTRFEDLDDIRAAINYNKLAVDGTPAGDSALPQRQQNLAMCLLRYFEYTGDLDDLKLALDYSQMAVDGTPTGHIELPQRQQTLASIYTALFYRLGNLEDLEQSILYKQASIDVTPAGHPQLPVRQFNLGVSYTERFRRLGDMKDLGLALKYNKAAAEGCPPDHPDLPHHHHTLAMSYIDRFQRLGDLEDVEMALKYSKLAVEAAPVDHPKYPGCQESLAICYANRFTALHNLEDLELALKLKKLMLEGTPKDKSSVVALHASSVAVCYRTFYDYLKNLEDLDEALKYHQLAVDSTPDGHTQLAMFQKDLASAYATRFLEQKNPDDLQHALQYYRRSTESITTSPATLFEASKQWGSLALENNLPECLEAFSTAFKTLSQLIWIGNSVSVRHNTLIKYDIPHIAGIAAAAAITFEKPELAIEFIEQGLAVTYRQLLQLRDDATELHQQHPTLADKLKRISMHLKQIEKPASEELANTSPETVNFNLLAIEWNKLLLEVRNLQGFENFFLPTSYQDLSVASKHGPIIMINCTSLRSDAIIILGPQKAPRIVPLQGVTPVEANRNLEKLRLALELHQIKSRCEHRYAGRYPRGVQNVQKYFESVLSWLQISVLDPVFNFLYDNGIQDGRIWWCPSGPFTYLPLHAPGANGPFIHSYTSTLSFLIQARSKKSTITEPTDVLVTALGVTDLPNQPRMRLPSVAKEIDKITSILGEHRVLKLEDSSADVDSVLNHIQKAKWLHLACHGQQDLTSPLQSGLLLQNGTLKLSQILESTLPAAEFVFLSACQTAMGDSDLVNESMHLTGGLIAAGFKSAVGTLWSMADSDGPFVTETFYQKLFGDGKSSDVTQTAEALHYAVQKLQNTGVPFERWVLFVHFGI